MDSIWALSIDLASAKVLVWLARLGGDADLTPDAHFYFFDRYRRLADYHRRAGRLEKAKRYQKVADEHRKAGGVRDDGPPYAAAMAMPRPRRMTFTNAVARMPPGGPDDAA